MIEYVTIDSADALDAFVAAHPRGHIMQTSAWGRVKQDWLWHGLICRDGQGRICGTLALLEHRCRLPGVCLLYGPRGPIYEDEQSFRTLAAAAIRLGRARGAWLLRLDPETPSEDSRFSELVRSMGFRVNGADDFSLFQPRICYWKDLSGLEPDTLLASWHRTARTHLRRALEGPLRVRIGTAEDLPTFQLLMEQTAARCGFRPRPQAYFAALLAGLGAQGTLYLAEDQNQAEAAAISAWLPHTGWFLYGCSTDHGRQLHANELLQWTMQQQAIARGCARWDLRGAEGPARENNPKFGLHRYKQSLGGSMQIWVGQLDLVLRPGVGRIYRLYEKNKAGRHSPPVQPDATMEFERSSMRYGL